MKLTKSQLAAINYAGKWGSVTTLDCKPETLTRLVALKLLRIDEHMPDAYRLTASGKMVYRGW